MLEIFIKLKKWFGYIIMISILLGSILGYCFLDILFNSLSWTYLIVYVSVFLILILMCNLSLILLMSH
jgi:hypothetical protein